MPLLLLHGAIGSSEQLKPLHAELLQRGLDAHLFDFTGHGGREIPDTPFSIALFAEEVVRWMDGQGYSSVDIFGYSMGGYVALYLAKHYPERVGKILTVATKFGWDVPTAQKEVKMLDPEKIAEKVPKFAAVLEKRHAPADWKTVLGKTAEMMLAMGAEPPLKEEDFRAVGHHVGLCIGENDNMVSLDETLAVVRLLANGSSVVLPQTPHPVEQMNMEMLAGIAQSFFSSPTKRVDGYFH